MSENANKALNTLKLAESSALRPRALQMSTVKYSVIH